MCWEEINLHRLWKRGRKGTIKFKRNGYTLGTNLEKEEMNLTISCNALEGITTPQTLKIEGYIKKKKVIVLIDSGSTPNFIHCKVAKELNFFLYPTLECKVMVENGGTINCSGNFHNIKLTMGEYLFE